MSTDDLKADLATNIAHAKTLHNLSTVGDVANHINNVMWPFIENVVGEIAEQEEDLSEMYHRSEDTLQAETAALFTAVFVGASGLLGELEKRLVLPADAKIAAGLKEWKMLATEAAAVLEEIAIPSEEDEDEDEADEGDDDDDDGDDAPEEKA